jgi:hypothetical protein
MHRQPGMPGSLQRDVVVVVKVVQSADVVTLGKQSHGRMHADKTAGACNQNLHDLMSSPCARARSQ